MRAVFGIGGILVVLGVIVMIMNTTLKHDQAVIKAGNTAKEQVSQLAGVDPAGGRADDSIDMDILTNNRKPVSILVTKVVPGGAYEKYFGLERNDTILAVEHQGVKQTIREMNDDVMARAQVAETYQRRGSLYVKRTGQSEELKLPRATSPIAPAPRPAQSVEPAAQPNPPPGSGRNALQRQLDAVTAPR